MVKRNIYLLWWLALPLAAYVFYLNYFARHHIKTQELPAGTITIPLQPDSSDLVPYIYKPLPYTIQVNDSIKDVIEKSETFVYVLKDSCWLEHVLTGHVYVHGKDSLRTGTVEIRDRQPLKMQEISHSASLRSK